MFFFFMIRSDLHACISHAGGDANFLFHVILILVSECLCLRHVALARI